MKKFVTIFIFILIFSACTYKLASPDPTIAPEEDRPTSTSLEQAISECAAGLSTCDIPTATVQPMPTHELEIPQASQLCQSTINNQADIDLLNCMAVYGDLCQATIKAAFLSPMLILTYQLPGNNEPENQPSLFLQLHCQSCYL